MTRARIRGYSIVIAAVLWTMWAIDMSRPGPIDRLGTLKGTDFLQFYVGGSFAREGRLADFYDVDVLHARAVALVPASRDTLYLPIQSPQTALAFAPLAALPYGAAVAIWLATIVAIYTASCWWIWRRCTWLRPYRSGGDRGRGGVPGLYSTMLNGQTSVIALAAVTSAVVALERGRRVAAGVALGCLAFKPHWCAAAVVVFVVAREWRVAASAVASAGAQFALAWAAAGSGAMIGYARILRSMQRIGDLLEPRPRRVAARLLQGVRTVGAARPRHVRRGCGGRDRPRRTDVAERRAVRAARDGRDRRDDPDQPARVRLRPDSARAGVPADGRLAGVRSRVGR